MKWVKVRSPYPTLCPVPCRVRQPPLSSQCPGCGILGAAQLCPLHLPRVPLLISVSECALLGWGNTKSPLDTGRTWRELDSRSCPCALAYICCAHFCLAVPLPVWQTSTHTSSLHSQVSSLIPGAYLCVPIAPLSCLVIRCCECSLKCLCPV